MQLCERQFYNFLTVDPGTGRARRKATAEHRDAWKSI